MNQNPTQSLFQVVRNAFCQYDPSRSIPNFVVFHVPSPSGETSHPKANVSNGAYLNMLGLLFRSIQIFHKGAICTLLTTPETNTEALSAPFNRENISVNYSELMLERTFAQLRYVEDYAYDRPLVFLDSDILLNGSLASIFSQDFDVGVTWRNNEKMPINGGFLVLNNRRPEAVRLFFQKYARIYRERYSGQSAWFGDQYALKDCIGLSYEKMADTNLAMVDDCRILFLPCETYNFSPENCLSTISSPLFDKVILHFKGPRKHLMESFWNTYLYPLSSNWPWARWKRWAICTWTLAKKYVGLNEGLEPKVER